jgi:predicted aldo/keto reductase-like oxidoreductase
VKRGFTEHQAKLKAVWDNPHIASICSQMASVTILTANVAAAVDKTSLTAADRSALRQYAQANCSGYCAGCSQLCEDALDRQVPVGDVMRSLMYHRSYGDPGLAKEVFAQLPQSARAQLGALDYSAAERVCPHHLPIAQLMREAAGLLG